jgi:hypothetical protein
MQYNIETVFSGPALARMASGMAVLTDVTGKHASYMLKSRTVSPLISSS